MKETDQNMMHPLGKIVNILNFTYVLSLSRCASTICNTISREVGEVLNET